MGVGGWYSCTYCEAEMTFNRLLCSEDMFTRLKFNISELLARYLLRLRWDEG